MRHLFLVLAVLAFGLTALPRPAAAQFGVCCNCCRCNSINSYLNTKFNTHRTGFFLGSFWTGDVVPEFKLMIQEIGTALAWQTSNYGRFMDGQALSRKQVALQKLRAGSVNRFSPSDAVCRFGTMNKSLAASDEKARATSIAMAAAMLDRNLGAYNTSADGGDGADVKARYDKFKAKYCDPSQGQGNWSADTPSGPSQCMAVADFSMNKDANFTSLIWARPTLDVDFTNSSHSMTNPPNDEQAVLNMANYLYGNRQLQKRLTPLDLKNSSDAQNIMMEKRKLMARRALAMNSYTAIVSMKASGSGASNTYLENILKDLGMSAADIKVFTGANQLSSYYAQMDILTRRLYQDPAFYARLMDKRANLPRQQAAMDSVDIMQDRDIYNTVTRSEMLLALLVEMEAWKAKNATRRSSDE